MLESLASAIDAVVGTLLDCHGGVLSLAADPPAAKLLHQLLQEHGAAPAAQAAQAGDVKPEAKPLEGGEGAEAGAADVAPTWAAGLARRVQDSCRAVQAVDRLMRGEVAALHTLFTSPPSQTNDPVVLCLSSDLGFGVLAALLQSGSGGHTELAHYAAMLLLRVLASPRGAYLSVKHAHWVRDLVKEVGLATETKDTKMEPKEGTGAMGPAAVNAEGLAAVLRHLECVVQPALLLLEHGTETLATSIQSLLQGRPSDLMSLRPKGAGRRASPLREHCVVLTAAFRVLRGSVARKQVAAALFEGDCLRWLGPLLEQGAAVFEDLCYVKAAPSTAAELMPEEPQLLWMFEAVAGVIAAILQHLSESGLPSFKHSSLFESLCQLYAALPSLPAAAPCVIAAVVGATAADELQAERQDGGVQAAALALNAALLRATRPFLESSWSSCVPALLEFGLRGPREGFGVALLLAQAVPPALPVTYEQLLRARQRQSPGASAESPHEAEPRGDEEALHSLARAMTLRRQRWRGALTDAGPLLQQLMLRLAGSSCQQVGQALAALLVRVADVLVGRKSQELVVAPLLQLLQHLGRCVADGALERPPCAPGEPAPALGRVVYLLGELAASPSGRAGLLLAEPPLLASALLPALQPSLAPSATCAAALQLLQHLCEPRLAMAALCHAPRAADGPEELPAYAVLAAAVDAVLVLSTGEHAASADQVPAAAQHAVCGVRCAVCGEQRAACGVSSASPRLASHTGPILRQARRVLQHLQGVLAASPKAEVQKLGAKLAVKEGAQAASATNGGTEAPAGGADAPTDEAVELAAASRAPIWPRAWRVQPAAETSVLALLAAAEAPVFGGGVVQTELLLVDDEEHPSKRARSDEQYADGAPPPVRGGRGRVREDNPPLRGKPNTSRPASKHVDDFMQPGGGGPKRFANSSRAPSKHVDDYQPAPVVRKTVRPGATSTATAPRPCHTLPPPVTPCHRP